MSYYVLISWYQINNAPCGGANKCKNHSNYDKHQISHKYCVGDITRAMQNFMMAAIFKMTATDNPEILFFSFKMAVDDRKR